MEEIEILTTQIGEFVFTEIDNVERIEYEEGAGKLTAFTINMEKGTSYTLIIRKNGSRWERAAREMSWGRPHDTSQV